MTPEQRSPKRNATTEVRQGRGVGHHAAGDGAAVVVGVPELRVDEAVGGGAGVLEGLGPLEVVPTEVCPGDVVGLEAGELLDLVLAHVGHPEVARAGVEVEAPRVAQAEHQDLRRAVRPVGERVPVGDGIGRIRAGTRGDAQDAAEEVLGVLAPVGRMPTPPPLPKPISRFPSASTTMPPP